MLSVTGWGMHTLEISEDSPGRQEFKELRGGNPRDDTPAHGKIIGPK